ncbi:DISARM system helicase DrmA [Lipingzhangella sp. LS1_29]|uniref:DISARM system helicase DrmA n=1 Tax=Lipingzhangella rawalii TaxID=2055835 RepID=A0ABU2H986_9ACTN|nr:DISARM system helicase DrmA [Lipingzhangella rawalii]MDS1271833.1 DISARM system helicase DrmA [Lipingzhangella rawalii]
MTDSAARNTESPSPVLDVPLNLRAAPSPQVRDELEDLVRRDLLGPRDGDYEEFAPTESGPLERYLVGRLGPKQEATSVLDTTEDGGNDTENATGSNGDDGELTAQLTPQNAGKLWASAMGLSFVVAGGVDVVHVTAEWGRYDRSESLDEDGATRRVWSRQPARYTTELRLDGTPTRRIPLTVDSVNLPGVHLRADIRTGSHPPDPEARVVELSLVNTQTEPSSGPRDTAWLFQPRLTVTALDGHQAVFLPIDDPLAAPAHDADHVDAEEQHLRLLYRNHLRYAAGRNVAVHTQARTGERQAHRLQTTWLPTYDLPDTVAPSVRDTPHLTGLVVGMTALAEAEPAELARGLAPLAEGYTAWLDEQQDSIGQLPDHLRPTAESALSTARDAAARIREGITLLTDPQANQHTVALEAFRFANEAMALQRRHTLIGELRENEHLDYATARERILAQEADAPHSWRPFQLAFVLLNLPALTDPGHPERSTTVDLLFFPTGGGKTEAYLGLAAYTFALRRLQGVVGSGTEARSGEAGVAVLMRYTLRLLTAQQFQRAAALVCATEVLRRGRYATGDTRWGAEPFRIGLWVGRRVAPNSYTDAEDEISKVKNSGGTSRDTVLQTLACPWCGAELQSWRDLRPDGARRRVLLYCPNSEGMHACPFSESQADGEGLPIHTVDEEIYRLAPSLVIATVDKLAQLPWNGQAGILFGRVSQRCPRHGYRHADLDRSTGCTDNHGPKGALPKARTEPVMPLRPPDLIIQDELHLISGALGTVVGQFESAVAELCRWRVAGTDTSPKVVASTATTKRSAEQVRGIFARGLAVFPPPILDVGDNFFSRQVPVSAQQPGRRYLGLCAHGIRLKQAEIRLSESLLLAAQRMFDTYGAAADPYMTLVGYFNSTRELAGMRRYLDDDVTARMRQHATTSEDNEVRIRPGGATLEPQELTARVSSGDISGMLRLLNTGFDPEYETTVRRRALTEEAKNAHREKRDLNWPQRPTRPVDVLLATSMLQVGVDVSRLGLMVVTGQPKNTAEYIQASSRVGRDPRRPGLVVTLYNWSRPRDLAHYEDFEYYHATFYRQVEALSITPYTRRALDRGAAATFVAALRHRREEFSRNADAHHVPLDGEVVTEVRTRMLDRAGVVGGQRAREYLDQRLADVLDRWRQAQTLGSSALGYQSGSHNKQQLRGLLTDTHSMEPTELTVARSMRETENEINLLVPATNLFTPQREEPWSYAAPEQVPDQDGDDTRQGAQ